ncbi:unnamed protein product, partial [Linum tenue]
ATSFRVKHSSTADGEERRRILREPRRRRRILPWAAEMDWRVRWMGCLLLLRRRWRRWPTTGRDDGGDGGGLRVFDVDGRGDKSFITRRVMMRMVEYTTRRM